MKNITIFILILLVLNSCTLSFFKKSTEAKKISNPEMSPSPGSFTTKQYITLSSENGASIRYTTDGSIPSKEKGLIYSSPVELSSGTITLKALSYKDDYLDSDVVSGNYSINVVADPVIIPNDKFLAPSTSVSMSTTTQGASIRYTLDGSTPSQNWGSIYNQSFTINSNTTIKAIAFKSEYGDSQVVTVNLKMVNGACADPIFTPISGTYNPDQQVTLSCTTTGASIRYTTDGTNPSSTTGTLYTNPIVLTETTNIKAIATANNYLDSQIVSANYTISNFPSSGLVAQWLFNGNADDSSGNNLNGTNYGCTLTKDRFGNDNSAYNFIGSSFIEVAHDDKLNCYPMTISLWVKTTNVKHPIYNWNILGLFHKDFDSSGFALTGSTFYFKFANGGWGIEAFQNLSYYDYKWHNIILIINDTGMIAYKNSIFNSKIEWGDIVNTKFFNGSKPLTIGIMQTKNFDYRFIGEIDDFRIYNRTLTDQEIQELYKEGGWNGN
ncbi:MAG TPA: chitobiase/beta-hexosaminidase C-terminal domain-containing protein [Bacteroidales bacterium]|nr:chitobiase/beta-hexosaminidase C-terminal domain-containing protein [Bacteroidales bacterium]